MAVRPLTLHPDRLLPTDPEVRAIARRRYSLARCARMDLRRLKPGVWVDDLGGVAYLQNPDGSLTLCDYITRAA